MSKRTISRQDFIKGILAAVLALLIFGALNAYDAHSAAQKQLEGERAETAASAIVKEYTSTAASEYGDVTVTLRVEGGRIADVEIRCEEDVTDFADELAALEAQILAAQGAEIDGVSGATVTGNALKEAIADCLAQMNG